MAKEIDPNARMIIGVTSSYTTWPWTDVLYVSITRHGRVLEYCGQWGDIGLYCANHDAYVFGPIDADPETLARQLVDVLRGLPAVAA